MRKTAGNKVVASLLVALFGVCVMSDLHAAIVTWTGSGDGINWSNGANWDSNPNPPADGDQVSIPAGKTAVVSSATAYLSSFDLSGVLIFTNWTTVLNATNVTILSGGTMTHPLCNTNAVAGNTNRVYVSCSNLTVQLNGKIDVTTKGYAGVDGKPGQGPGGTISGYRNGGAGYGSVGGAGKATGGGPAYGSITAPVELGSAGGGVAGYVGGHGGGAIRIQALGKVTIDGVVSADGGTGSSTWTGSGSGGSIYITCNTLEGTTGTIRANGGPRATGDCGGGGGGRIAVTYDPASQAAISPQPTVKVSVSGREDYYAGKTYPGSLCLPNNTVLPSFFHTNSFSDVTIYGVTSFEPSLLTVSNTWIRFMETGVVITVGGDLRVTESSGRLDFSNGTMEVASNLIVTNGAKLYVYGGDTNSVTAIHGVTVQVTNDVIVGASSWIYPVSHPTNGLSPFFRCRNLAIETNGGFNATGGGYTGPATAFTAGRGPGAITNKPSAYGSGSGYGGVGGASASLPGGPIYGDPTAPVAPGSSGPSGQTAGGGGNGGGLVRIQVESNATVNGAILANANNAGSFAGGGSGGGVYIVCRTFGGGATGIIQANGGNGGYYANSGAYDAAGGGGRIAIVYNPSAQSNAPKPMVRFSTSGATNFVHGQQGTLYFPDASFFPYTAIDGGYTIVIPGFSNWAPDSLTVSNGWIQFPDGFVFSVTNNVTVSGSDTRLILSNATLACGGSLLATNFGQLHLYSSITNGGSNDYGALVAVTQDLVIASNSVVYPFCHPTNGGGVFFSVKNLSVALGGQINAKGLGFAGPPASGTARSRGPGGPTMAAVSAYSPGAGHGGLGGSNSNTVPNIGGPIYGNSNAPIVAGSSGWSGQDIGGNGGGLIRIEASGAVTVDGVVTTDGSSGGQFSGGGSGGAVYIRCRMFTGATTGRVLANGAKEGNDNRNGAGAGGRIAVWSVRNTYQGLATATGAVHVFNATFPERSGGNGTVVWGVLKGTSGTLIQIR